MNSMTMLRITEDLGEALGDFHNNIVFQLKSAIHPSLKHNHVPVRFLVQNCEYCQKYGNCFNQPHRDIQEP